MAIQIINIGQSANDRKGDSLRTAFQKINANFEELYTTGGVGTLELDGGSAANIFGPNDLNIDGGAASTIFTTTIDGGGV
jgi:chromosome segregation ATPase